MKIKGGQTKSFDLRFGAALLVLIGLLILSLMKMSHNKEVSPAKSKLPTNSQLTDLEFSPELLELQINQANYKQIKEKREEALQVGLLFTTKDDFVPADMRIETLEYPIDIRLKGDLLDHIKGDKWSYRIQLKNNDLWRDMSVFSIQNSAARSHLAEWYMHQLFRLEGVMSTRYDFIKLEENGNQKGVYAYEEHFTDELLVAHKKPIGPILKHNDDAYWKNIQKDVKPFYWTKAVDLELFNTAHKGEPDFMKSFEYAKSMLQGFLNSERSAEQVFDVDKMAKYYALMELSHGFHSQQITNIRFYFNPLSAKLEPIAFDCFGVELPAVTEGWSAAGEGINAKVKPLEGYPYGGVYMHLLFRDEGFFESYLSYLFKFSKQEYIDNNMSLLDDYVKERELFIQQDEDYKTYQFSADALFKKAGYTRKKIPPLPDYSIKVFTKKNSTQNLVVKSFHYFPMEIIGFGTNGQLLDTLAQRVFLEAYNAKTPQEVYSVRNKKNYDQLFYSVLGLDSHAIAPIRINNIPEVEMNASKSSLSDIQNKYSIDLEGDVLSFNSNQIEVDDPLIIPSGLKLLLKAGQRIHFSKSGCLISKSPVQALGTASMPIELIGERSKGQAILITGGALETSVFKHCHFKSLHSLKYAGMHSVAGLTMSVEATLMNCVFEDMHGESALAMTNANVTIQDATFTNCVGHALTCEYSVGDLDKLRFEAIGGDAIQAKYSALDISESYFDDINGQAILTNKMDKLALSDISIYNSFEGIHVRHTDSVFMEQISLINLQNGIQVDGSQTQSSHVTCVDVHVEDTDRDYTVDQFSTLILDKKRVY